MAQFRIPGPLRRLSDGQTTVEVEASDLSSAIEALDARYPGFRERLLDEIRRVALRKRERMKPVGELQEVGGFYILTDTIDGRIQLH